MAGWCKESEKHLNSNNIIIILEYYRSDWLGAPHSPNTKVQTLHSITLYEFN